MVEPGGTLLTAAEIVAKLWSRGAQLPTAKLCATAGKAVSEQIARKSNDRRRSMETPLSWRKLQVEAVWHLQTSEHFFGWKLLGMPWHGGEQIGADGMTSTNYALLMTSGRRGGIIERNHYAPRSAMTSKIFNYTSRKMRM